MMSNKITVSRRALPARNKRFRDWILVLTRFHCNSWLSSCHTVYTQFLFTRVKRQVAITGLTFKILTNSGGVNSMTSPSAKSRGTRYPVSHWVAIVTWVRTVWCILTLGARAVSAPALAFRSCQRICRSLLIKTMRSLKLRWETGTSSSSINRLPRVSAIEYQNRSSPN